MKRKGKVARWCANSMAAKARIEVPKELEGLLVVESCEDFPIDTYILPAAQKEIFDSIVEAKMVTEEMQKMGLAYMNSTLLYGPPGTGKTTFARYVAYKLNMDLAYINFAKLVDGVFGNTSRKIDEIFAFMAAQKCVFLFDEIDCVAVKRGEEGDATGGELSRITISIMQAMDYYRSRKIDAILIACTNRIDRVDPALRSRFSIARKVPQFTNEERRRYIENFLGKAGIPYDKRNVMEYCARNPMITARNVESDEIRCIVNWIKGGKQQFVLDHIQMDD